MSYRDISSRFLDAIAGGANTTTKMPGRVIIGVQPFAVRSARHARLVDVSGDEWLDWQMGLGSVLLGYGHPAVEEAVTRQVRSGPIFSLSSDAELRFAERLLSIFPEFQWTRLARNGSDVTSAAVRIARAATSRDYVVTCGYHGWDDWSLAGRCEVLGIPRAVRELTIEIPCEEFDRLLQTIEERRDALAAVVIDPFPREPVPADRLRTLRDACNRWGILLVFDEIVSGFRLGLRGITGTSGVAPDLLCLGKAIANGYAMGILLGREALRAAVVATRFTTTFAGDAVAIAAANAVLDALESGEVHATIEAVGASLQSGLQEAIDSAGLSNILLASGVPALSRVSYRGNDRAQETQLRTTLMRTFASRRIFWMGNQIMSAAHEASAIDETLEAFREGLAAVSSS